MTFATLVFGRVKVQVIAVTQDGAEREFEPEEAADYFDRSILAPWRAYDSEIDKVRARRADLKAHCVVRTHAQAMAEWNAGPRRFGAVKGSPPGPYDEITVDGRTLRVDAGSVADFIDKEALRKYPDPTKPSTQRPEFEQWSRGNTKEKRTWRAELVTGAGGTPVELGKLEWQWGYPIAAALRELDRLEKQGWKLVHVSEDHGLYSGADTNDEAYLTRVRYLLRMD